MKKLIFMIIPVLIVVIAFRPINTIIITGKVSDEQGLSIPNVSVSVKGTGTGITTKPDGTYSLTIASRKSTLVFSAVGMETVEKKVGKEDVIDVVLKAASSSLESVVVTVPYGTIKQTHFVGSEAKVSAADMSRGYVGAPGASTTIHERRISGVAVDRENFINDEQGPVYDTEGYDNIVENIFLKPTDAPLSTFSIDVDAASYSNVRRFLNMGQLPPAGAVRIEEMVNYFNYTYPQPTGEHPFSINTEIGAAPWNPKHKLVMIGLQGKKIPVDNLPASNLVFLIDVSGSMSSENKLPLVRASMKLLVDQLRPQDKVSIVVYAGAAGLVLKPTDGTDKTAIKEAINNLEAGGSTAGGAGIKLAYKTAREAFVKGGNNRVILCSDGDFNIGESSDDAMVRLIEKERESGIFLTVLGYGMGNYKDSKMQQLADKGNGNHAYIDGITEAKKVLVNEFGGTLFTIAKDVKLQLEFNPARVKGYRLIGYENRMLAAEDFNDDKKDAGELGSGHTVTALYEIIPVGVETDMLRDVDALKYQQPKSDIIPSAQTDELLTIKFRYKAPDGNTSKLITHPVKENILALVKASDNFYFASAVAQFGLLLRDSKFKGSSSFESVLSLARKARANDENGYRSEFVRLVESASMLKGKDIGKK